MKFPSKCPYCAKDIAENICENHLFPPADNKDLGLQMERHKCIHCGKYIYVFRRYVDNKSIPIPHSEIESYYPISTAVPYPERVKYISPVSYAIYQQTCHAREAGLNTLLGAGLRMSLEWLVWDYLIKVQNEPEEELEKLTLAKRINRLQINDDASVCVDIIRIFGNDQIHIKKLFSLPCETAFAVYNMLLSVLDRKLEMDEYKQTLNDYQQSGK